jgi:hypothetical protein
MVGGRKYSCSPGSSLNTTVWPAGVCGALMAASKSSSVWSRQNSAVKNFSLFSLSNGLPLVWPIPSHTLRSYVTWALNVRRLSPATVRMYISDLKNIQKQKDLSVVGFDDFFVNSVIKGAENLSLYNNIVKRARLAM